MPQTTQTVTYDDLWTQTLQNYRQTLEDVVSNSNNLFNTLMKGRGGVYEGTDNIGTQINIPLMTEIGTFDSYSGYDELNTSPMEGVTAALFDWRQASIPVSISGLEERMNAGSEVQLVNMLKSKVKQAEIGIQEGFARALLQGNGGAAIRTPRTSVVNGSVFIDPLPKLVDFTNNRAVAVGAIDPSLAGNAFWRNQVLNDGSSSFAGFLRNISKLFNDCTIVGPGGGPDIHICDQNTFEYYESALRSQNRYVAYTKADIPFESIGFRGHALTMDNFVPDASGDSATQSTTSGTWYQLNSKFVALKYDNQRNFSSTPFMKPVGQDAKVSHILWLGGLCISNRRKHGVAGSIDTTPTS